MTVYCVTEPIKMENGSPIPLFDLTPAAQFGEIEILLKHSQSFIDPTPLIKPLYEKLVNFGNDDYILPTGDPTMIALVGALCAYINDGRFKVLKWDKRNRAYYGVQIDIDVDMGEQ
jgi:hypothetical protein